MNIPDEGKVIESEGAEKPTDVKSLLEPSQLNSFNHEFMHKLNDDTTILHQMISKYNKLKGNFKHDDQMIMNAGMGN